MRNIYYCLLLVLLQTKGNAQSANYDLTTVFAFQVHSIDDFFDRFNFRKGTAFQNFLNKEDSEYILIRANFIKSLFNFRNNTFNTRDVYEFISYADDSITPKYLSYDDNAWYAELKCSVLYKKKRTDLKLIMKVERSARNTFRWCVVSSDAPFLKAVPVKNDSVNDNIVWPRNPKYSLSPVSHGIDFLNIENIFLNPAHVHDYFAEGTWTDELQQLALLIQRSEIIFVQVNTVTYHLLQLNGWIMEVEYFNRYETNSGWLINRLIRADEIQKTVYLKDTLNLSN